MNKNKTRKFEVIEDIDDLRVLVDNETNIPLIFNYKGYKQLSYNQVEKANFILDKVIYDDCFAYCNFDYIWSDEDPIFIDNPNYVEINIRPEILTTFNEYEVNYDFATENCNLIFNLPKTDKEYTIIDLLRKKDINEEVNKFIEKYKEIYEEEVYILT